jgi:hypothetical protein
MVVDSHTSNVEPLKEAAAGAERRAGQNRFTAAKGTTKNADNG